MALIAGLALAEGVNSANTVGYTTANVPQDTFYMLGLQYEKVGGGAMSVQDLVKGTFKGVNYDDNFAFLQTAPKLQVWTPSGYVPYYYLNDKDPNEACTVTTPGQVVATATSVSAATDVFTMGSVPYPVATPVNGNSTTWTGISGVNYDDNFAFLQTAPKLQVWTPSGYVPYYYLNDCHG